MTENAERGTTTDAETGASGAGGGAFAGQKISVQNDLNTLGSAGASIALSDKGDPAASAAVPDFQTQLGDFAKDPSFANIKDVQGLAKTLKEAQTLVGKKLGIPGEQSTPEEKMAFYKALGVPDAPEGYGLKKPEGLPEAMNKLYDESILPGFSKTAKELNLTPAQAAGLQKWYDGMSTAQLKEIQEGAAKSEEAYVAEAVKIFGSQEKAEQAQMAARVQIEKYVSPELRSSLNDLPNNMLLAVASVVSGLSKDMTGEDKALSGEAADGQFSGKSVTDLREEGRRLQSLPSASNVFDAKHKETRDQIKAIYAQIGAIENAAQGRRK